MKEKKDNNRTRWLHLRLTPLEYRQVQAKFHKTTCRKLSDYIRSVIFEKPVITTYRNISLDECMAEMILLNKELNAIGQNINQVVKKMHTLQAPEFTHWTTLYEKESAVFYAKAEEIKNLLANLTERWLRS